MPKLLGWDEQTDAIENQVLTGSPPILTGSPFIVSTLGTTKSGNRTKSGMR